MAIKWLIKDSNKNAGVVTHSISFELRAMKFGKWDDSKVANKMKYEIVIEIK